MLIHNRNNTNELENYYNQRQEEDREGKKNSEENIKSKKEIVEGNLFLICNDCRGEMERWHYDWDEDGNDTEEFKSCETCKGKGYLVIGEEYLKYQVEYYSMQIPLLTKVLNGEMQIPYSYLMSYAYQTVTCEDCQGEGRFQEQITPTKRVTRTCQSCGGQGHHSPTHEEMLESIRYELESFQTGKEAYLTSLNNKEFLEEKYAGYEIIIPNPRDLVCVKCVFNFDGTNGQGGADSCCGCVNESGWWDSSERRGNGKGNIYFSPANEEAKEWYNNGGYRNNIVYDENYDYTIK